MEPEASSFLPCFLEYSRKDPSPLGHARVTKVTVYPLPLETISGGGTAAAHSRLCPQPSHTSKGASCRRWHLPGWGSDPSSPSRSPWLHSLTFGWEPSTQPQSKFPSPAAQTHNGQDTSRHPGLGLWAQRNVPPNPTFSGSCVTSGKLLHLSGPQCSVDSLKISAFST